MKSTTSTLNLPMLTMDDRDRKTNIIIKSVGAFTTKAKPTGSTTNLLSDKKQQTAAIVSKKDTGLMEKLLSEITAKYKPYLCSNQSYL